MADGGGVLRLEPCERFSLLVHALEEVPLERRAGLCEPLARCASVVMAQMMGRCDRTGAYFELERLRGAIEEVRRG